MTNKSLQYYNLQKVEHVAGFKFEHRGPVSAAELEEAAARDVKEQIAKLPEKVGHLLYNGLKILQGL